ncbi:MAG: biopolymer transporter ExbD [Gemmatimonadota bacterium]|nr:MAG: biopolymer transporter ExbD [Gemmatimonadota bacterium]
MGMQVGDSGGGPLNEPNVVPMIDILLVLLIIFMMQVPLQRKAMDTQVPPVEQREESQSEGESDQIVLEMRADGTLAINTDPVTEAALDARLHEIYDNRPAKLMFLKPARNRRYQEIMHIMDIARGAGVQVIGLTPKEADETAAQ